MKTPRVSIVVPTYHRPTFLTRAIESVQAQSWTDWELIVVDDNGTGSDHQRQTEGIIRDLGDSRIRYIEHARNRGGSAARNTGIAEAVAPFVAFLDDDDEWHREKLALQLSALAGSADDVALAYCGSRTIDDRTGAVETLSVDGTRHSLRHLLKRNTVGSTSCIMCRHEALVAVGAFDESLPSKQDIDLYVRLSQRYRFVFVDEVLLTRHLHADASIGKNVAGTIRAHELFFEKYRPLIEAYPEVLHHRLLSLAKLLIVARRFAEARPVLMRAWRLRPFDYYTVAYLAVSLGFPSSLASRLFMFTRRLRRGVGDEAP
jgi:glycosyltransferase involved in cell wall biosynthesis